MISKSLILSNYDDCPTFVKNYEQKIIFINKKDVESYEINTSLENLTPSLEPIPFYRIDFKLKENKKGFAFINNYNNLNIKGSFSRETKNNKSVYKHQLELLIIGINEHKKHILSQFSTSDEYFAVIQHNSGIIEVYGFFTGLEIEDFESEEETKVSFSSVYNDEYMPFIFDNENASNLFDNNFSNEEERQDFNEDFNEDYLI